MLQKAPGVYVIEQVSTGKRYIGSSKNMYSRCICHRSQLRRGLHHSKHLQRAWDKYGETDFTFDVLEEVPVESLREKEQQYFDTEFPAFNCHKTASLPGPYTPAPRSTEHNQKISMALKGRKVDPEHMQRMTQLSLEKNTWKGRRHSEETKEKLRQANLGKQYSDEHRQKLSELRTGKRHSEETRRKISEANRRRHQKKVEFNVQ